MILRLACGGNCSHRPAVETVDHRDDVVASGLTVEAGELDGGFHGLGAAVAEETQALKTAARAERLGEATLRLGVPGVRDMDQLTHLLADRGDDARRAVTQKVTTPTRKEIQVAVALGIPDEGALAAHQTAGVTRVVGDDVLLK